MTQTEEAEMREVLTILEEWGDEYKMSWGREKTALLVYGDQRAPDYQISGGPVTPIEKATALGVDINNKGTADAMIEKVVNGVARMTGCIRHNLRYRDDEILKFIYNVYVKGKLLFGSEMWHQVDKKQYAKLWDAHANFWKLSPKGEPPEGVIAPRRQMMYQDMVYAWKWKNGKLLTGVRHILKKPGSQEGPQLETS